MFLINRRIKYLLFSSIIFLFLVLIINHQSSSLSSSISNIISDDDDNNNNNNNNNKNNVDLNQNINNLLKDSSKGPFVDHLTEESFQNNSKDENSKGNPKEELKEDSKENSKENSKEELKEDSKDSKNSTEEQSKDLTHNVNDNSKIPSENKDESNDLLKDLSKELPKDIPKNNENQDNVDEKIDSIDNLNEKETHHEFDPESPEDSSYAKTESENELVDENIIKDIIEEYHEDEQNEIDPNPLNLNKDWSIKLDNDLSLVTSEDFSKGNKITQNFFTQLLELIYGNKLSHPLEDRMRMENGKTIIDNILFYSESDDRLSEYDNNHFLTFPDNFIEDLTAKHKIIVDNIPDITPSFYSGSGYVIVGGGKYSWFAFLVIETLRKLGSSLPVEVIIPTQNEYEVAFCEITLPKYNARCIQLQNVFDAKILDEIKVTGYQYKSLALLASSFENAFLLDSDNYPVINPDPLFTSQLYKDYTMITWPDYWRRTTSPKFYQVRGTKLGKRIRHLNDFKTDTKYFKIENEDENEDILINEVSLHDREGTIPDWTTESGEMLINKKIHFKALLLALYYNLDGQFGYYPLLSQGGAGEGDKETFVAASNFYNLKYYQVNKMPDRAYGFFKYDFFFDTSIIQYDPIVDYENLQKAYKGIEEKIESEGENFSYDYTQLFTDRFQIENSKPMFYHVHETKMDPFSLYENKGTQDLDGKKMRNLGGDYPRVDFDLESFLWKMIEKHICKENTEFEYFKDKDKDIVCGDFMKIQLEFLEESGYDLLKRYIASEPYDNLRRTN